MFKNIGFIKAIQPYVSEMTLASIRAVLTKLSLELWCTREGGEAPKASVELIQKAQTRIVYLIVNKRRTRGTRV